MPDLMQIASELRRLPDQALQRELTQPSPMVPSYLVLAEAQRRQTLRTAATSQPQSGTVYDEVLRNMMARQPPQGLPPAPVGMAPAPTGQPSGTMGSTPPQNFKMMARGGPIDDDDEEEDDDEDDADNDDQIGDLIQANADKRVNPNLVRAVIDNESGGDPNAVSPKGATGLMQLMPDTAKQLKVDPTNPGQNVQGGSRYLGDFIDQYGGDVEKATAAYNAGGKPVARYGGVPNYPETRKFVNNVMSDTARYGRADQARAGLNAIGDSGLGGVTQQADTDADTDTGDGATFSDRAPGNPALSGAGGMAPPVPGVSAYTPPAPPPPAAAAPAPAPASQPTSRADIAKIVRSEFPTLDQSDVRQKIAQLEAQYKQNAKPNIWRILQEVGSGMASAPFGARWGQAIGLGGAAVAQGETAAQEENRKAQLSLLGVNMQLDNQAREYQEKLGDVTERAVQQAATTQRQQFQDASKVPGTIRGAPNEPHPGYTFTANPDNPQLGAWSPPGMQKAPKALLPYLGVNPATGKPFAENEPVSTTDLEAARKAQIGVTTSQAKAKPTITGMRTAAAIDQMYASHPELTRPIDPNTGQPKDPASYQLSDVNPSLLPEVNYNLSLATGMTHAKALDMVSNPNAPAADQQRAKAFLDHEATQTGAMSTARTTASQLAQASQITPEALDLMGEQALNGTLSTRNPMILAKAYDSAAQKARARGLTAQAVLMERNSANANKAAMTGLVKTSTAVDTFSSTAQKNMDLLEAKAKEVSDFGAPLLNTPLRSLEGTFGSPKVSAFHAAIVPVQAEIAKVLNSANLSGVVSDSARREMEAAISPDATYEQLHAALDVFRTEMQNRRDTYGAMIEDLKPKTVVGGGQTATTPVTGTTPARPAAIPADAEAQYSPARKQWRFKPKGSTEWQTLPNQ